MKLEMSFKKISKKILRTRKAVRLRKTHLDKVATLLSQLLAARHQMAQELESLKSDYLRSVKEANERRQSKSRTGIHFYEQGLDFLKEKWTSCWRDIGILDKKIEAQKSLVDVARRDLRVVEELLEKYKQNREIIYARHEQKNMDEFGIHQFSKARLP